MNKSLTFTQQPCCRFEASRPGKAQPDFTCAAAIESLSSGQGIAASSDNIEWTDSKLTGMHHSVPPLVANCSMLW